MRPRDEQEMIDAAKRRHDAVCGCDPRYLMSCSRMAQEILKEGSRETTQPTP